MQCAHCVCYRDTASDRTRGDAHSAERGGCGTWSVCSPLLLPRLAVTMTVVRDEPPSAGRSSLAPGARVSHVVQRGAALPGTGGRAHARSGELQRARGQFARGELGLKVRHVWFALHEGGDAAAQHHQRHVDRRSLPGRGHTEGEELIAHGSRHGVYVLDIGGASGSTANAKTTRPCYHCRTVYSHILVKQYAVKPSFGWADIARLCTSPFPRSRLFALGLSANENRQ